MTEQDRRRFHDAIAVMAETFGGTVSSNSSTFTIPVLATTGFLRIKA